MTLATRFAQLDVAMIQVPNLTDGGIAALAYQPYLTGGEAYLSVITFFCQELSGSTGSAHQLSAFTLLKLDIVHQRTHGNVRNGQAVARANFCLWS
jgi:hypothetical protein